jgi:aryl-alcohol dehydrogenase-like predicted oxidoreductase
MSMKTVTLGQSGLQVPDICLGTMTFGAQVDESTSHAIMARSLERGLNFMDTAEMYAVPPTAESFNKTEKIIGNWFAKTPGLREKWIVATKVAGPGRGMNWVRGGKADLSYDDIVQACEGSLKRMNTDYIDLYQIHWPVRHVPAFGNMYFNPALDVEGTSSIHTQLQALDKLVRDGKVRAIGLSNESSYGVHEFVRLAEQHGLARIATVQNPYSLVHRSLENGLDETMYRLNVSLLAYSPLAFGLLTGKYDESGLQGVGAPAEGRLTKFESMRKQRWGRPDALKGARRYNALARQHGMTPVQFALAFCASKWQVASTIIGVTTVAQLDEQLNTWGQTLSAEVLAEIDKIRWDIRDPAI